MSIPKEPRQLMINIMYLVLTALLALNVSAEIFNAFEMVDKGLKAASATLDENNAAIVPTIKERAKKKDEYAVYAERVDQARALSKEATDYIQGIVNELIDEAGNDNGEIDDGDRITIKNKTEWKGKRDYDATTRLMVDEGRGMELKNKMLEYRTRFLELVDEPDRATFELPIEIDDEAWKNSVNKKRDWAHFTFGHMPLGATEPIFSKFNNDIKASEAALLNYYVKKVGGEDIVLDKFTVVSAPKKTYVIKGERFETDVFLSAAAGKGTKTGISISVNGQRLPVDNDGIAKFSAAASTTGKKTYNASITVTNPVTNDVKTYKNTFEYEVGERSVAISPTKMNVFYIGVPNPVEVSAAGVPSGQINVSMSGAGGGSISKNSDGTFTVNVQRPTKKGEFAKINVSAPGMNASKDFRVKRIPDPVPMLGKKRGGKMGNGEFKIYTSLRAALDNFDFDAKCNIAGFRLAYVPKRQDPQFSINKGGKYNNDTQRLVAKAKPGDRYYFENIKCKCPGDAAQRDIGQLGVLVN